MEHKILKYESKGIRASGYIKPNNAFVILKGSFAVDDTELRASFLDRPKYVEKRRELIGMGKLKKRTHDYQFTEDVEFDNPSLAAIIIWGCRLNGRKVFGIEEYSQGEISIDDLF